MAEDRNIVVFSRPTPVGDRLAFAVCGLVALGIACFFARGVFEHGIDLAQLDHFEIGLLATFAFAALSFLALAVWGGTNIVTIDRRTRTLREIATIGPFTAVDKSVAFKDLGDPVLRVDRGSRFVVEVPVRDRVEVQVGIYASRAEAEDVLSTVNDALAGAEPLGEPVSPLAINPLKVGVISLKGPVGF